MTEFVNMPIPVNMYTAVCALLGGVVAPDAIAPLDEEHAKAIEFVSGHKWEEKVTSVTPDTETVKAEPASDRPQIDADGHPFDPALHTGTITKAGLWRMKAGVSRPAPMPGFPKTETPSETSTPSPASPVVDTVTEQAGSTPTAEPASAVASPADEEDEFAAFREAQAKVDAVEAAAAANVPARVWTDADLAVLCNQAAVKLNDPAPVKALIAEYVPAGEVAHSRNIPADKRVAFVAAVEAKAGIEFAG